VWYLVTVAIPSIIGLVFFLALLGCRQPFPTTHFENHRREEKTREKKKKKTIIIPSHHHQLATYPSIQPSPPCPFRLFVVKSKAKNKKKIENKLAMNNIENAMV